MRGAIPSQRMSSGESDRGCSLFPLRFLPNPVKAGDQRMVQFLPVKFPMKAKSITCRVVLQTFQRVSRGGITFFGVRRAQSGCPMDAGSMGQKLAKNQKGL